MWKKQLDASRELRAYIDNGGPGNPTITPTTEPVESKIDPSAGLDSKHNGLKDTPLIPEEKENPGIQVSLRKTWRRLQNAYIEAKKDLAVTKALSPNSHADIAAKESALGDVCHAIAEFQDNNPEFSNPNAEAIQKARLSELVESKIEPSAGLDTKHNGLKDALEPAPQVESKDSVSTAASAPNSPRNPAPINQAPSGLPSVPEPGWAVEGEPDWVTPENVAPNEPVNHEDMSRLMYEADAVDRANQRYRNGLTWTQ